mgnify:CR=1 FL=1
MKFSLPGMFFLVLFTFQAGAQTALLPDTLSYSQDSTYIAEKLATELARYDGAYAERLPQRLLPVWRGEYYSEEEKDTLIFLINHFAKKYYRVTPHVPKIIDNFIVFAATDAPREAFEAWLEYVVPVFFFFSENVRKLGYIRDFTQG